MDEPVVYAEDRAPDLVGANGRAWKVDLDAVCRRFPDGPPRELTVSAWVVEAPWAHPMWHSYTMCAISLRTVPGWPPAHVLMAEATHEIMLYALDPGEPRALNDKTRMLHPGNFHGQWKAGSDEAAAVFIEETVKLIINGHLNPDTDARSQWIARFSASNMKIPTALADATGLGVAADGALVVVGTGKTAADIITGMAAGPKPDKKDMH